MSVEPDIAAKIRGALARAAAPVCPKAVLPLKQSTSGGSGSFLVRVDDGRHFWCKSIQSPQGKRVAVNEQIVGRVGRLLDAPTCDVSLVEIPAALEGWEFRPGQKLLHGYVHGSLALDPVIETRAFVHPADDQNPTRMTTLRVLADWCWAADHQWLYASSDENRYFSHDHGHYFPSGPDWSIASLRANPAAQEAPNLDVFGKPVDAALVAAVGRLQQIGTDAVTTALAGLPQSWPVSDDELSEVVLYLERRRIGVIDRVEKRLPQGVAT